MTQCLSAQISNPVTHFESLSPEIQPIIKWEADINGDGKLEVFLSLKKDYDDEIAEERMPAGWFVYFADTGSNTYTQSVGIKEAGEDAIGVGVLPMIDLKVCFVGLVTELGKHAVVTEWIDNPRAGESIARIYAYTIEGDRLKRTKLAEYDPTQTNALFDKYLKDGKRTVITPVEVTQ